MEDIDRRIVELLSQDGRMSFTDLGKETGLSTSAVHQRVRRLEKRGVIRGYRATIDPEALGLSLTAFVSIKAFDASADGFVRAEGCGVLVLKRLSHAQADGDGGGLLGLHQVVGHLGGLEAHQLGRDRVVANRHGAEEDLAILVTDRRAREAALPARDRHGHPRHHAAGVVRHHPRNRPDLSRLRRRRAGEQQQSNGQDPDQR